jgi:lipopolysaccharide/colanic/teichoic acid biosynthesis glycosyltransferase
VLAAVLLVPGLPMIGLLILLVRFTSRGPGICRQIRAGQGGRKFAMYKIRTVRHDAGAASGPMWTCVRNPRVTAVGRLLRRLHLDGLPQLLSVLKGDMSLVGPRPERPEFVHVLAEAIPGYQDRLVVPPGVTGLAQLNLPPDSDLMSVCSRLVLDREYIDQAGLLLDTRLLCCASLRMLKLPKHWMLPIFGLRRDVPSAALREETSDNGDDATVMPQ